MSPKPPVITWLEGPARALARKHLRDTCVIQRPTAQQDSRGGLDMVWADVGTFECRVDGSGLAPSEAPIAGPGGPIGSTVSMTLRLPYPLEDLTGAPREIRRTDRVIWRGLEWQVEAVADPTLAYETSVPITRVS